MVGGGLRCAAVRYHDGDGERKFPFFFYSYLASGDRHNSRSGFVDFLFFHFLYICQRFLSKLPSLGPSTDIIPVLEQGLPTPTTLTESIIRSQNITRECGSWILPGSNNTPTKRLKEFSDTVLAHVSKTYPSANQHLLNPSQLSNFHELIGRCPRRTHSAYGSTQ